MVKSFFWFVALVSSLYALDVEISKNDETQSVVVVDDPLTQKIKSYLSKETYEKNRDFIKVIFDPVGEYYFNERVDAVKVIKTLKENGLLDLFFEKPQQFQLDFRTNGSPLFFVKLISDTLSSMGYYKYTTVASQRDVSEFVWSVAITSEYAADPLILQKELHKRGCEIVDIERKHQRSWSYFVDISNAKLNVKALLSGEELVVPKSLDDHWFDVSAVGMLEIRSARRNRWYPYIAYYDASLHLLKVIKKEKVTRVIDLQIPPTARYIKISDLYTIKNIKDELTLLPSGAR